MKELPIGEQSFENLRLQNQLYVDKTSYILSLFTTGGNYKFLSRPRRFGKSLLLSTIKAVFEGKKELFEGLYIYDKINWEEKHPVVLLDMGQLATRSVDTLIPSITDELRSIGHKYNIDLPQESPIDIFRNLIRDIREKTGRQVVILIDEYDKPILDSINDLEKAARIRAFLQNFYAIIKGSSTHLRFVLLTGVSKISQTSIFSGLNNISDITLQEEYAAICGYTQQELESSFGEHITQLSIRYQQTMPEMYQQIKRWYDGYSWDGQTFVYNPFSVLKLLEIKRFKAHWFTTGTPTFLIKLLQQYNDYSLVLEDKIIVNEGFEDTQSLENMQLIPLFFQTGYLTIKKNIFLEGEYELQIPNEEVKKALLDTITQSFVNIQERDLNIVAKKLYDAFDKHDLPAAMEYLKTIYSNASYHEGIYTEGYYQNLFEIMAKFSGMDIEVERRTDIGRADCILKFAKRTYVIEMKYSHGKDGLQAALEKGMGQIKEKKYYQPWLHQGKQVHLLAMAFTKGEVGWMEEVM